MTQQPTVIDSRQNYLLFGLLAVLLVTVESFLIQEAWFPLSGVLPLAVLLDFALTLPFIYYFLVLRPKRQGILWAIPIAMVGIRLATTLLPTLPQILNWTIEAALVAFEIVVLVMLVRAVRKVLQEMRTSGQIDFLDSVRAATAKSHPALRIAAEEITTFYYSFVGWRKKTPVGTSCFSYHRENSLGILLGVLGFLSLPEMAVVHYLVALWNPTAAWIMTGLGIYSLIWIAGLYQAARLRPMLLAEDHVAIRVSLLWNAIIPYGLIKTGERISSTNENPAALRLKLLGESNIRLTLNTPVTLHSVFGIRREATILDLVVDEPERYVNLLQTHLKPPETDYGTA